MKKIAIIGGGISGLSFANLLEKNSNYNFTIFEKRPTIDMGDSYGIQLSANSIKILNQIGFKNLNKNEIYNPKKISFINAANDQGICELDISKFNYQDCKYTTLKRSTLVKFLLNNISKEKFKLNTEIKNISYKNKIVLYFNDNSAEEFDYLIVADGVFSKTKSLILNKTVKPQYFQSIALRANINQYKKDDISLYLGSNFHFVIYPINQNKEFNFISIIKKKLSDKELLKKDLCNDEKFLTSITKDLFKKTKIELDGKLNNIKSFPVYVSRNLEISNNKNIFFLGDALFAMPPTFAQGASQSIESSKELFDQIENISNNYYKKRIKRLDSVNFRSKLNFYVFHLSNPITIFFRNYFLKILVNNKKFLETYLGKIYRN